MSSPAGFKTITLLASAGPRFLCVALSRIREGAPPETIRLKRSRPIIVSGPHFPSITNPAERWNSFTADSERGP